MNTQLFCSRYIVPIGSAPIEDGSMAVEDGRIVALGPKYQLMRRFTHAPCTDHGDAILLPALVNAHTHLELSHFGRWQKQISAYTSQNQAAEKGHGFTNWILRLIELKKHLGRDAEIYRSAWHTGLHQSQCYGTGYIGDILTTP